MALRWRARSSSWCGSADRSRVPSPCSIEGRAERHVSAACPTIGGVTPELSATLATLPDRPGVYLMKDARGEVLYVGKAQSLRNRVRSYWQKQSVGSRGEIH